MELKENPLALKVFKDGWNANEPEVRLFLGHKNLSDATWWEK